MDKKAIALLKIHEGFRQKQYRCSAGHWTIGRGYNLDANPLALSASKIRELKTIGITESEAEKLMIMMVDRITHDLQAKLVWWSKLNDSRQYVFIDMAYNMGVVGLMKFKNALSCAERADYLGAAEQMLNSKWSKDVNPKNLPTGRNHVLAVIMRNGKI
jgi:lysozyme